MRRKKIISGLISLTMLASAMPMSISVSAAETIPSENVNAAKTWYSSQLNTQAKSIYDLLCKDETLTKLKTGNTDIDLNEATEVTSEDVEAYLNGDRTLINDFTAAKDAFDLEHPEIWYVDYDYLSFRAGEKDGEKHAFVGIGRADTYYLQQVKKNADSDDKVGGITSTTDIDSMTAAVESEIEAIASAAEAGETLREKVELAHDGVINRIDYRYENECKKTADGNEISDADMFVKGDSSMISGLNTPNIPSATMTYVAGKVKITVPETVSATIIQAQYDDSHNLVKASADTVTLETGTTEYDISADTDKIMLWDSLNNPEPLTEALVIR